MTKTAAIRVVIRILRRALVPLSDLLPYHAARKQQPTTPALARSLSWKNATRLSNSQDRPARPLMRSRRLSFSSVRPLASDVKIEKKIIPAVTSVASCQTQDYELKKIAKEATCQKTEENC